MVNSASPASVTIIFVPGHRGIDPWLEHTVAIARTRPERRSVAAASWKARLKSASRGRGIPVLLPPARPLLGARPERLPAVGLERFEGILAVLLVLAPELPDEERDRGLRPETADDRHGVGANLRRRIGDRQALQDFEAAGILAGLQGGKQIAAHLR